MDPVDIAHRFTYHAPTDDQPALYESIRVEAKKLANYLNDACPDGSEKSLAITHLGEVVFWANASIARS